MYTHSHTHTHIHAHMYTHIQTHEAVVKVLGDRVVAHILIATVVAHILISLRLSHFTLQNHCVQNFENLYLDNDEHKAVVLFGSCTLRRIRR